MLKALYLRIAFFTAALVLIPHLFPCIQESENAAPRIEITQVKILGFYNSSEDTWFFQRDPV